MGYWVKNPPVYPISKNKKPKRKGDYSGYADPAQLKHETIEDIDPSIEEPSDQKVVIPEHDGNDELCQITKNGDVIYTISMNPMSYSWFTIKTMDD